MAIGVARVFTSCGRQTGERPMRWTYQWKAGDGGQGSAGLALSKSSSISPLGAPESASFEAVPFPQGLEVLLHQDQPSREPQEVDVSIVPIFQMRKQRLGDLQKLTQLEGLVEFGSCAVTRA